MSLVLCATIQVFCSIWILYHKILIKFKSNTQWTLWLYRSALQVQLLNNMIYSQMEHNTRITDEEEFSDALSSVSMHYPSLLK
jgi:hypothetical protein